MPIDYSSKTVLVLDDHPGMRASIRTTLSHFGVVKTDMASTAFEAMRRIKDRLYDIIVCDYDLGDGRDGQQFLEGPATRSCSRSTRHSSARRTFASAAQAATSARAPSGS